MRDSAQQVLDTSVQEGVSDEEYRLAGGIFTKRQLLEMELRHVVGLAFHFRRMRLGRKPD